MFSELGSSQYFRHTGVNVRRVIHRSSFFSPTCGQCLWITPWIPLGRADTELPGGHRRGYFHCVETPNPAAMKPKPTTMFQLPSESMGREPSVT